MQPEFFPDDPVVLSFQIFSGIENSWQYFEKLRDDIITETGVSFFHSSIGYRFVVNIQKYTSGIIAMKSSCMRYIGVDLDDTLSLHLPCWFDKLRTINWKVSVNTNVFNKEIANSDIIHWQTGERPSICDRNSDKFNLMLHYRQADRSLRSIIYTSDNLWWLSEWQPDIYKRWANRWDEISNEF